MPAISRLGDNTTGHSCFPPRPNITAAQTVFVNGIPFHRVTDNQPTHCCGDSCHDSETTSNGGNVFVEGKEAASVGYPTSCGDALGEGSKNCTVY